MDEITTVAIDLAKSVFQLHGVTGSGEVVLQRKLRRSEMLPFFENLKPVVVGLEACAGAHFWGRKLAELGHQVRLVPPRYVKPYVQRQKNDVADAAAIYEAMSRPAMRFVPVKSAEQQATRVGLKAREILTRQRNMTRNALRAHLLEFGVVTPLGAAARRASRERLNAADLPEYARAALHVLLGEIEAIEARIAELDRAIIARCREDALTRRLMTIPGIGPLTASAIASAAPEAGRFSNARHFSAWLGLVPRQHSSGGKARLGGITKMGDRTIRRLLVSGATALILAARKRADFAETWLGRLLARKPHLVAANAVANKLARICWAVMAKNTVYAAPAA